MKKVLTAERINIIVFIILALYPLLGMGIDLIAPSLPAISDELKLNPSITRNLISIYLIGYGLGNLILGFLSDIWGRKKLMLGGLLTFSVASLLPLIFPHIDCLLLVRFIQGAMMASLGVLGRVVFLDILSLDELPKKITWLSTMWGIGPIIGPVIGGYLQNYYHWQACFIFFASLSFLGFLLLFIFLPETHVNRTTFSLKNIGNNILQVISHRAFIGAIIMMVISYSMMVIFNTLAPFYIQNILLKSSLFFGKVALWMGVGFLLGTILCRHLLQRFPIDRVFFYSLFITLLIAIVIAILLWVQEDNFSLFCIGSFLVFIGSGILFPAGATKSSLLFRHIAGSATAVTIFSVMCLTGLVGSLTNFISIYHPLAIIELFIVFLSLGLMFYRMMIYKYT